MSIPRFPTRRLAAHALRCALLLACTRAFAAEASAPTLMRYPTLHGDRLVFVAHDELWIAPASGGTARPLVRDPGEAIGPRFSPDGRWIAFTSRRGGRQDLYVVPAAGGEPKRLTFEATRRASDALVLDWTPDSRRIVYLSSRGTVADKMHRAWSVAVEGGPSTALPLDETGPLSFAPDGHTLALDRVWRNDELRKRYVGGQAQGLCIYDLATRRLTHLPRWKGTDTDPMWAPGRKVYFLSDRGPHFRRNLWVVDLDTQAVAAVTHFGDADIDAPSLGDHAITFQQGGKLYALELPSQRLREIRVDVPDDGSRTAARTLSAGGYARVTDAAHGVDYGLSPDGREALLSAHGDLFRVAADGRAANLTQTPGADEQHPAWSPDGQLLAYQTDRDGTPQIAVRPAADGGAERVLTHFTHGSFYAPLWSPDSRALVVPSANHELWWVPLDGSATRLLARDPIDEIRDAAFSPDSAWLAYSTVRPTRQRAVHLLELATGRDRVASSPMESDRHPVFSADGRTLYFISQRNEAAYVADRGDEALITPIKSDGLYAAPLWRPGQAGIEPDGLMARATRLPVEPAEIATLEVRGTTLFYETRPPGLIEGDLPGEHAALHAFDLATHADRRLAEGLDNHALSADGSTVLARIDDRWHFVSTAIDKTTDHALDLGALRVEADPRQQWREMFEAAWRLDRDLFFSPVHNGTDWDAVHRAYAKYLPLLGSQADFLYLLGQMQGELGSSHTFIDRGPDSDTRPAARTPLLGADLAFDTSRGCWRLVHILPGDATRERYRSPLREPGVDANEGDCLLAVDGHALDAGTEPLAAFVGAGDTVRLTLAAPGALARSVAVQPIDDETDLRQKDWADRNRARVEALSGGRIGYVFVADFEALGSEDFLRQFYPQLDRQGLVIDVRWNDGGFTSQAVLGVLRRARAGAFVNREGALEPLPRFTAPPALATLVNGSSGSDGDQFPYYFRQYGLGPLVGMRTWGGVQGIKAPWRLLDGTGITIPKDSLASLDGHWLIENEGVAPDIAIDSAPDDLLAGHDRQLERAVQVVARRIAQHPVPAPRAPAALPAYPAGGDVPGANFGPAH